MKFKSEVLTQASGSIGGVTYAHNRGGLYRRARTIPTNPNSSRQQVVRSNFSALSTRWSQVLTIPDRAAWENYAANNPVVDTLGDPLVLTGQQMFIRCNSLQNLAGEAAVDSGPVVQGLVALTPNDYDITATSDEIEYEVLGSDPWFETVGGFVLLFASRQVSPAINFHRGPMRFVGFIAGDSTPPPVSGSFTNPFGDIYLSGNKVFFREVAIMPDGRISSQIRSVAIG